jgi:two-component system phosphate regulon response regulator PhoB
VAGALLLDTLARKASVRETEVHLGPTEYRLLEFFVSNQGRAYSRAQILDHVWGTNVYLEERTVDVHIRRLRLALQATGISHYVQTVRGHGYRFLAEG